MKPRKLADLDRFFAHSTRHLGMALAKRAGKGSHWSYGLRTADGRKICSLVLKIGKKEVSPGVLRNLATALRAQRERCSDAETLALLDRFIEAYERWLRT